MMAITTSSSTNVKAVRGEGERRVVGGVECFIEFRQGQIACRGAVSAISAEKQGRRWGRRGWRGGKNASGGGILATGWRRRLRRGLRLYFLFYS